MHTRSTRSLSLIAAFSLLLLSLGGLNLPAATLTVSPSVISNTYPGNITLNIGGLTNGESVTVQKWLDLNANGAIDAGDLLIDAFNITDGGAMLIGGITNISVPFDSNATTGAITTALNFAPPVILENITGHQLYRVASPGGNFSPVTATFNVTNAVTPQSITGTIYSNGVAPLPYAVVVAVPASGYAGATVADGNGHYSLSLDPGPYFLIATAPNYYYDQSLAPTVVLTNGVIATNNLSLTNGTTTIAGSIYNSANSNGVGGLMVELQSGDLFAIAFTDTSGNYSAAVTPNFWKIKPTKERLSRRACVVAKKGLQVNASSGNVTNANLALFPGTALYYGRIVNGAVPLANIRLDTGDGTNDLYSAIGYSDLNGYFSVVALGGVSGDWSCQANDADNPILDTFVVNSPANSNIAVGQTLLQNFFALPVTAHITGQVLDNLGNPVSGVNMYAGSFIGGISYSSQNITTDEAGNYSLGVASGTWGVNFSEGGDGGLSTSGDVDYFQPHLVTIPPTNVVLNITVFQNGTPAISSPQRLSPSQFGFDINGQVNASYEVQVSTNLNTSGWNAIFSLTLTNSPFPIVDTHATNSRRFYRILKNQGGT